ncbi:MAG: hypothetical protein HC825_04200 [Oscillatoriales cyanobacterium RM1_1_9]|nr:hypothetical protein [Oscillatoriales cyanobacterium RM1_1_9]
MGPVGSGNQVAIGNLTTVGGTQGFVIFEGTLDINGNGLFGDALAFVVNNSNITRPLSAVDFV